MRSRSSIPSAKAASTARKGRASAERARILVAHHQDLARLGLRSLLEERPGWEVVAQCGDGRKAFERARRLRPDVTVLEAELPGMGGLSVARRLRDAVPDTRTLLLATSPAAIRGDEVDAAGVAGVAFMCEPAARTVAAVQALLEGRTWLPREPSSSSPPPATETLTPREREVVRHVAEGLSSKEIASSLALSVRTVDTHRANVMRKLRLRSVSEVVRYAVRHRLVDP